MLSQLLKQRSLLISQTSRSLETAVPMQRKAAVRISVVATFLPHYLPLSLTFIYLYNQSLSSFKSKLVFLVYIRLTRLLGHRRLLGAVKRKMNAHSSVCWYVLCLPLESPDQELKMEPPMPHAVPHLPRWKKVIEKVDTVEEMAVSTARAMVGLNLEHRWKESAWSWLNI